MLGDAATEEVLDRLGRGVLAPGRRADRARKANIYARLAAADGRLERLARLRRGRARRRRARSSAPSSWSRRTGAGCMRHRPGQYLTFALDVPGAGHPQAELLRSPPAPDGRSYRISVKREARPGTPPGLASNWLHDQAGPGTRAARSRRRRATSSWMRRTTGLSCCSAAASGSRR